MNNLNLKIGDRVIRNYGNSLPTSIGIVVNITEKRGDYKELHYELAEKKGCSTCKHCIHVRNYPGFVTAEECECSAGLECDTVLFSVINCPEWIDGYEE